MLRSVFYKVAKIMMWQILKGVCFDIVLIELVIPNLDLF